MIEDFWTLYDKIPKVFVVIAFLVSLIPLIVFPRYFSKLPNDYFFKQNNNSNHTLPTRIMRNLIGVLVLIVGIILLFLPGQGLVLILFGLTLIDFPGKRRLLLKLFSSLKVRSAFNRFRKLLGAEPFIWHNDEEK